MQQNDVSQLRWIKHFANGVANGAVQIAHPCVNQGWTFISYEELIECDSVLRLPR